MERKEDIVEKLRSKEYVCFNPNNRNSEVWKVFQYIKNVNSNNLLPFVKCVKCDAVIVHAKGASTSNLQRHKCAKLLIRSKHETVGEDETPAKKHCPEEVKKNCLNKLVNLCAKDLRPYNIVAGDGFGEFVQFCLEAGASLGPAQVANMEGFLPHPSTVSRHVKKISKRQRENFINEIKNLIADGRCSATTDIWTSEYTQTSFITLTIHFIDEQWKLRSHVLFTTDFEPNEKKTGDNIVKVLKKEFNRLNIGEDFLKHIIFVTDRGSNILNAMHQLNIIRFNCNAHILNNVLKETFSDAFLIQEIPELNTLLSLCKQIVRSMKKSGDIKKLPTTLKQENVTRWNSNYKMLNSIGLNFKDIQQIYENTATQSTIDSIDETMLNEIAKFLKPFKIATEKLETDLKPMFGSVVFIYGNLKDELKSYLIHDDNADESGDELMEDEGNDNSDTSTLLTLKEKQKLRSILSKLAQRAIHLLDKLFTPHLYHHVAAFLNPNFNQLAWLNRTVQKETKTYVKNFMAAIEMNRDHSSSESSTENSVKFYDEYSKYANCSKSVTAEDLEYKLYQQENRLDGSWIEFWKQNENRYPKLSKMAKKFLAIPASSASSERVFSTAGRIVEERRTQLSAESIDALLFLNKI